MRASDMAQLRFIFISWVSLVLLVVLLHQSILTYVEQTYHNFSESKSVVGKFFGTIYAQVMLDDNALFVAMDLMSDTLEQVRKDIFRFGDSFDMSLEGEDTESSQNHAMSEVHRVSPPTESQESKHSKPDAESLESSLDTTFDANDMRQSSDIPTQSSLKASEDSVNNDLAKDFASNLEELFPAPTHHDTQSLSDDLSKTSENPASLQDSLPRVQEQETPRDLLESSSPIPQRVIANPYIEVNEGANVLLIGDSMMQGVAPYIVKSLKKHHIHGINLSKHSTGLTYKHYFDWESATREALSKNPHIELVVVILGANDPWTMKKSIAFKTPPWEEIYLSRIQEIIDVAQDYGARVVWYEVPAVREEKLNAKIAYLNDLYERSVRESGEFFLQTNGIITQGAHYSAFIKNAKGKSVQVRIDDGVHFTSRGYKIMADILLNQLIIVPNQAFHTESQEDKD